MKKIYFFKKRSLSFVNIVLSATPMLTLIIFNQGTHRFPYSSLFWSTPIDSTQSEIKCIHTNNIIVRRLDYHNSEARGFVFDDTLGLYQTAVNFYQDTLSTSRVLLCNSLGTTNLFKLSAIWIWRGPCNRKFSAPSSPSEQCGKLCSPAKNRLKPGFCSEKSLPSERC